MKLIQYPAIQVRGNEGIEFEDTICLEDVFRLYLNDELLTELVASADQLQELGAGFVVCEGLAQYVDSVDVAGNEIRVYARTDGETKWLLGSCGGVSTKRAPKRVISALTIDAQAVSRIIGEIHSEAWKKTGAFHSSVLFSDNRLLVRSNDVGRHNTVDKVVGFAVLNQIDLAQCVIGCTGRQPAAMVAKAANAGIPIIISRAASTYQGILTAYKAGITLICFARGERYTIYTHPYRISGIVKGREDIQEK